LEGKILNNGTLSVASGELRNVEHGEWEGSEDGGKGDQ
jgi:hypothetical protein